MTYPYAVTSPKPHSGGRVQRRRARNHATMLDLAEEMFSAAPYESVRIGDLAEAADVSIGTVYTHFGNKDGLYLAVVERAADDAEAFVRARVRPGAAVLEQIAEIADAYLDLLLMRPFLALVLQSHGALPADGEVRRRVAAKVESLYDGLAALIDEAIAKGEVGKVDSGLLARFALGSWTGVVAMTLRVGESPVDVDLLAACLDQGRALLVEAMVHRAGGSAKVRRTNRGKRRDQP